MIAPITALCCLLLAHAPKAPEAGDAPVFSAEDVFELEYARSPQLAPDGTWVVYERRSNDVMTDRTASRLWRVNVDGSGHRPLVADVRSATSPRFSPSGDRLAWLSPIEGGTGLFVRWLDSGATAQVARSKERPQHLSFSPDGRWLAFTAAVPAESKPIAPVRRGPEGFRLVRAREDLRSRALQARRRRFRRGHP